MSENTTIPIIGGQAAKPQRAALDMLFGTSSETHPIEQGIQKIPVDELHTFPNHPFSVREDEDMEALCESVREHGVLLPVLVRKDPKGGYQLISGHRRTHAAKAVGLTQVPALVEQLTDEEATIQMVDSNLQRERILPSEKARAYKMRLDAMKRQGKRTDLTSAPLGRKLDGKESREILAEQVGESRNQIQRYIRLNHLIPPLLDMVDSGDLPLRAAVELSYCKKGWQEYEYDMYQHDTKATVARAETARSLSDQDTEGKKLAFMCAVAKEEREKKEQELREKADKASRGELRKPRRVTLSEGELLPYFSELIPSKQVKADILYLLEQNATGKEDACTQAPRGASLALAVIRNENDEYEITCPCCGADLHGGPRTHFARQGHTQENPIHFCWVCGQKLDFGDDEGAQ